VAHWWIKTDQGNPWQQVEGHLQWLMADQCASALSLWTDLADGPIPVLPWKLAPVLSREGVSGFASFALAGLVQRELTGGLSHR
jgi:hypothetical protein